MRVRVIFQLSNKGGYVPFHHQYLLAQVIRGVLVKGGEPQFLNTTDYNFSGLKGQTKVSRKGLHYYSSRVTLVVASGQPGFIEYFTKVLFAQKELVVGNLHLTPEKTEEEPSPALIGAGKYLCLSPLVLLPGSFNEETGKRFVSPLLDEFSDLLYENTIARMAATGRYSTEELSGYFKFQVVPDKEYLQRIEAGGRKFSRVYPMFDSDIRYEVRGYTFPFTLYAPPAVHKFLFENGLGQCTHKGFGMLDLSGASQITQNQAQEMQYA